MSAPRRLSTSQRSSSCCQKLRCPQDSEGLLRLAGEADGNQGTQNHGGGLLLVVVPVPVVTICISLPVRGSSVGIALRQGEEVTHHHLSRDFVFIHLMQSRCAS